MKMRRSAGAVVLLSSIISSGLGFLFQIFVSRSLGHGDYAIYTVFFEVYSSIVMACDMGMAITFVNLSRANLADAFAAKRNENLLITVAVIIKLLIFVPALIIGLTYFSGASEKNEWGTLLNLSLACSIAEVIYQLCLTVNQSRTDFRSMALFRVILPATRITAISVFFNLGWASLGAIALIYGVSAFVCIPTFIKVCRGHSETVHTWSEIKESFASFWSLLKWNLLASFSALVGMKADVFVVASNLPAFDVAAYGAAQRFSIMGSVLTSACSTVLIPLAVGLKTRSDIRNYLARALGSSLIFAIPITILIALSRYLVPLVMGQGLAAAALPSSYLLASYTIGLFSSPFSYLFYSHQLAHYLTIQLTGQAIFIILMCLYFVPSGGIQAASGINLITKILGAIFVIAVFVMKIYRRSS